MRKRDTANPRNPTCPPTSLHFPQPPHLRAIDYHQILCPSLQT